MLPWSARLCSLFLLLNAILRALLFLWGGLDIVQVFRWGAHHFAGQVIASFVENMVKRVVSGRHVVAHGVESSGSKRVEGLLGAVSLHRAFSELGKLGAG